MRCKFLSLLAVLLLVSACASEPETSGTASGQGAAAAGSGVSRGGVTPGSTADFVTNVGDRVFFDFDKATLTPEAVATLRKQASRSEEHTSELQSLMRISYAVFCLKKKNTEPTNT